MGVDFEWSKLRMMVLYFFCEIFLSAELSHPLPSRLELERMKEADRQKNLESLWNTLDQV